LANDNIIKSEDKIKDILERVDKAQANKIQEIID